MSSDLVMTPSEYVTYMLLSGVEGKEVLQKVQERYLEDHGEGLCSESMRNLEALVEKVSHSIN